MLSSPFKNKNWFVSADMTVRDFLDFVLANRDIFKIDEVQHYKGLFEPMHSVYKLVGDGRSMRLSGEDMLYLATHDAYFFRKLRDAIPIKACYHPLHMQPFSNDWFTGNPCFGDRCQGNTIMKKCLNCTMYDEKFIR